MTSYTIPQLQELLTKQYEALKTNETVRELKIVELSSMKSKGEITCACQVGDKCEGNFSHPSMVCCSYSNDPQTKVIWDMKAELKSLHKKLDLQIGSNNPLNLKDKGFGFHSSGSPRSKPYHEILSESFKKLKEDNEKLTKENKKLKEKESVVDEVFEGLKKNEKEYIHRNNILQRENEKLKEDKFNYNVFLEEKKNMVILMEKQKEEIESLKKEEEFDYSESDDWVWGHGCVQKDNEYVIHISGGGDGVSPNGFKDWVIKKNSSNELEYFIRHGGNIPDKLQHDKMIICCPDGNYVSFVPDGAEHRAGS